MIIGLRHDVDTVWDLKWGISKVIALERKYKVRSTFFVRTDLLNSEKYCNYLRQIESEGWEVGLHLINTTNDPKLPASTNELNFLKERVANINGVTPCGSTIGFRGDATWVTMESLGLKYMEGYGFPNYQVKTFVMPTPIDFDLYYVRNFGAKEGYVRFKKDLKKKLNRSELVTVLVHPLYFVLSVGTKGRLNKYVMTILKQRMMNEVYEDFLFDFRPDTKFMTYIDAYYTISSNLPRQSSNNYVI
ncbi:MAG: hypothetical protein ABSB40_02110 [Nitrososphaeria archaeon]